MIRMKHLINASVDAGILQLNSLKANNENNNNQKEPEQEKEKEKEQDQGEEKPKQVYDHTISISLYFYTSLHHLFHISLEQITQSIYLSLTAQDYSISLHKITHSRCTRLLNLAVHKLLNPVTQSRCTRLLNPATQSRCTNYSIPLLTLVAQDYSISLCTNYSIYLSITHLHKLLNLYFSLQSVSPYSFISFLCHWVPNILSLPFISYSCPICDEEDIETVVITKCAHIFCYGNISLLFPPSSKSINRHTRFIFC